MDNLIGKYVWIEEDDEHVWVAGKIIKLKGEGYQVEGIINNQKNELEIDKNFHFMDVHHTCLEEIDDLLKLGEYNEPSLLHKIRERFYKDKICNLIGSQIVLYINPNKIINELENFQNFYQSYKDYFLKIEFEMMKKNVIPEITVDNLYYVTHKSYVDMLLNKFKTQNFIISGESCSGKSHAFRSVLNYLSFLSIEQNSKYDNPLENMIMEINNLLDSFGNASTEINPNSSRFTKYFDIMFNTKGKITALKLYCYFLEKSRVLGTIPNESNFHIFYQLINGSNEFEKKIYHVKEVNYFKYLRKGVYRSTAKEDLMNFQRVKEILLKIKFSNDEVKSIFTILAGVLYLGNIEFDMSINNQLQIRDNTIKDFLNASVLLGIDQERLLYVLTKCVKGDKSLLLENAYNNLNKISKILYSKTFNFIIKKINTIITFLDNKNSVDSELKIGILDFFGFEKKVNNGFEQFCRNYANEVLNQYYLNFNFKVQQEEYIKENIPWAKVGFNDNCDLLNLIDDVQDESIFSIIEKNQNENDKLLIRNIDKSVNGKNSKIIIKNNLLLIKHYNGDIEYNTNDFIENNCDFLDNDIKVVFEVANHTLLRSFFKKGPNYITKLLKKKMRKLYKLLYNSGNNIYLNCINPISNNDQENHFESIYVNKQLKSMSIIELLKIKKQSLPIRMNKEVFVSKYFQLMRNSAEIKDKNNVEQIFKDLVKFFKINKEFEHFFFEPLQIKLGIKFVYLDENIVSFLQSKLNNKYFVNIIKFQALIRKNISLRQLNELKTSTIKIQIFFRWRYLFKKKLIKNIFRNYVFSTIKSYLRRMKNFAREYCYKKNESDKKISLEFLKMKEKFLGSNRIKNEINIHLISNNDNLNKSSRILERSINNSLNEFNSSMFDAKPKIRRITKENKSETDKHFDKKCSINQIENDINKNSTDEKIIKLDFHNLKKNNQFGIGKCQFELVNRKKAKFFCVMADSLNYLSTASSYNSDNNTDNEEIKNLKNTNSNQESTIDILNLKISELTKSNKFLNDLNESLKKQVNKNSERLNNEMIQYHSQIKEIQLQKQEIERKCQELEKNSFSNHFFLNESIGSSKSLRENFFSNNTHNNTFTFKKKYSKKENQQFEKEISSLKSIISMKDEFIDAFQKKIESMEVAIKEKNDLYEIIKTKYDFCKNKITEFNHKLTGGKSFNEYENEIILLKNDFESIKNKNEYLILCLTDKLEESNTTIDHLRKIEEVLKEELENKELDLDKRQDLIKYIQGEVDKLSNENSILKKENLSLKENINKLEINEIEGKARHFNEMQGKNQEYLMLTSKIKNYEKLLFEMKTVLKKKQNLLTFKRSVNRMLIELLQLKKNEITFIDEHRCSSNPEKIGESISIIREKEKNLLNKMNNMANLQEYTTDSEDDSDDETLNKELNFDIRLK